MFNLERSCYGRITVGPSRRIRRADRRRTKAGCQVQQTDDQVSGDSATPEVVRYTRRLSDKILIAFHHACDQADFEVAAQLLQVVETMLTRPSLTPNGNRRRNIESLVAAHERLWSLRHPAA